MSVVENKQLPLVLLLLTCASLWTCSTGKQNSVNQNDQIIFNVEGIQIKSENSTLSCDTNLIYIESSKYDRKDVVLTLTNGRLKLIDENKFIYQLIPNCNGKKSNLIVSVKDDHSITKLGMQELEIDE
ncbi:MAG: hypothetical protein JNJ99_16300 [Crocinitomicaceae bacterium]|nr:hypothetical protein [Crocinitomicaceae bacterium]